MPIFRVKSVKIYTDQKKIYRSILVALMTNIKYAWGNIKAGAAKQRGPRLNVHSDCDLADSDELPDSVTKN